MYLTPKIGTYFTKFIRKNEEKGCLEASLRGRPLEGEILHLPEGYEATVIQAVGSEGDNFREVKRVRQVTYWNYDKVLLKLDDNKIKHNLATDFDPFPLLLYRFPPMTTSSRRPFIGSSCQIFCTGKIKNPRKTKSLRKAR